MSNLTKIEERAIAIEQATGAHRQHLLAAWLERYGHEYPQYAACMFDEKLVCDVVARGYVEAQA